MSASAIGAVPASRARMWSARKPAENALPGPVFDKHDERRILARIERHFRGACLCVAPP